MAKRVRASTPEAVLGHVDSQLRKYTVDAAGLDLRGKVLLLAEINKTVRALGVSQCKSDGIPHRSALERIKAYFLRHVGACINSGELEVVAGISEFARRIRELRVKHGYNIASGASPDSFTGISLRPDQYMLVDATPDAEAARRWGVANRIRNQGGSVTDRVRALLEAHVGEVLTTEQLAYVAKDKTEFARRTRELRTEQGYSIATRFTGRPDLRSGEYVLQNLDRFADEHDRHISETDQRAVYERDRNRCRNCGWGQDMWTRQNPRYLELHHMTEHRKGGSNTQDNLVVLCSKCHDEVHAGRLSVDHLLP
jgi:hypothetical protein